MRADLQPVTRKVRPLPPDVLAGAPPQHAAGSRVIVLPAGEDESAGLQGLIALGAHGRVFGDGAKHTLAPWTQRHELGNHRSFRPRARNSSGRRSLAAVGRRLSSVAEACLVILDVDQEFVDALAAVDGNECEFESVDGLPGPGDP